MRLLEILFYLLRSSSKVTIKELATVYNVSPRTIQRDLDKLSVLGIPIIIYRGKNGGVIIDGDYVINRQILRNNDYEKLMFSIYISENISKDIEEANLIDRFKILDKGNSTKVLEKLKEHFIVDLYDEKFDAESNICKEIDKALENKNYIEIDSKKGKITLLPISYVLRKEGLCLYGYNEEYKLLLIKDIYNVVVTNKKCKANIIDYRINKKNIKIV